jgi:Ca2+-binding EF-hand superfamily protein
LALIDPEIGLRSDEISEIWKGVEEDGKVHYKHMLVEYNPEMRGIMNKTSTKNDFSNTLDPNVGKLTKLTVLAATKSKMKAAMEMQEFSLLNVFERLGKDINGKIDIRDFKNLLKMIDVVLDNNDVQSLFSAIDRQSDGNITYRDLAEEFESLNGRF